MQNNNKKFELMKHIPNAHKAIEARAERSKDFCKFMGEQKKAQYNVKYGQNDRNVMDVFNPASLNPTAALRPDPPAPRTTTSYSWSIIL